MLSDMSKMNEKSVGWPEFMRFKHFPEKRVGVHEILYRYL